MSQPARDLPGTSPKCSLKTLTCGTNRESLGNSQWSNTKIDDLMKKKFFTGRRMFKSSEWTSHGPNDGTFLGRPRDVGHTCFLNSNHKHINLTLAGYSRLYSTW